jgi:hypothetical protein
MFKIIILIEKILVITRYFFILKKKSWSHRQYVPVRGSDLIVRNWAAKPYKTLFWFFPFKFQYCIYNWNITSQVQFLSDKVFQQYYQIFFFPSHLVFISPIKSTHLQLNIHFHIMSLPFSRSSLKVKDYSQIQSNSTCRSRSGDSRSRHGHNSAWKSDKLFFYY